MRPGLEGPFREILLPDYRVVGLFMEAKLTFKVTHKLICANKLESAGTRNNTVTTNTNTNSNTNILRDMTPATVVNCIIVLLLSGTKY